MNSRTSRPRSPTSAITFTSALVDRAIIPISEDLPTPEPAKMPRRWPRPHGTSVSSARTPRPTRSSDPRPRQRVRRRRRSSTRHGTPDGGAEAVQRIAEPVDHAAEQRLADRDAERRAGRVHAGAGADPVELAERHQQRAPAAEADDLAGDRRAGRGPSPTMQTSPISTSSPVASMISPIRSLTRPSRRGEVGAPERAGRASERLVAIAVHSRASAAATISRARSSWASILDVDLAGIGPQRSRRRARSAGRTGRRGARSRRARPAAARRTR